MDVLIFGAGASKGSGPCFSDNSAGYGDPDGQCSNPPLGFELFGRLNALGRKFHKLDQSLKDIFTKEGFEAGMAAAPDDSRILCALQRELACYLSSFHVKEKNAYLLLLEKIKKVLHKVNIVTLNYDLLIEQSLTMLDVQPVYHSRTSIPFNAKTPHVHLIKPHGSSNFTLNTKQFGSTFGNIQCVGPNRASLQIGHIEPVETHQEIVRWCRDPNHQSFCPAISLYEKEKRSVTNNNQILEMQTQFASIVSKARRVFLIGTALATQDTHIWDPIRKSKCELIVVDINPDPITAWAKLHRKNSTKALKGSFIELIDNIADEMVMRSENSS